MAWGQQVCPPSGAGRIQGEPTASASTATAVTVHDVPTGSRPGGHERHCGLGSWPKGLEPTELCHCSLRTALGPSFAPSWRQLPVRTRAARWPGQAVGTASKALVTSMACLNRQRDCSMAHKKATARVRRRVIESEASVSIDTSASMYTSKAKGTRFRGAQGSFTCPGINRSPHAVRLSTMIAAQCVRASA